MTRLVTITIVWKVMILILTFNASSIFAQNTNFLISEYKGHLNFLADDLLHGRFSGEPGGNIAALYIASQFEAMGLLPVSNKQGYYQSVPIKSFTTNYKTVDIKISGKDINETVQPFDEFLIHSSLKEEEIELEGDLVFVGYGIEASEFDWDDFKGQDLKGKILVFLSDHPKFKSPRYTTGNKTYYGHWEYKPKMAFDKGAKGILIIHENQAAFSWNNWQDYLAHMFYGENTIKAELPLISLINEDAMDRILIKAGLTTKELIEKANVVDFSPIDLQLSMKAKFAQQINEFTSPNVIGQIPGSENTNEAIIYMAHYDHLGIGNTINGDSIYNGAIDNASGIAGLITLAEYFTKHPTKRSIIFLATTAEEIGFLGAEYYLNNPVMALENTIIGLNLDMLSFLGTKDSIELSPVVYTDAIETIREISRKMNLELILSNYDNEFINFRLDSYPFAMHDIVTLNILNLHIRGNYLSMPDSEKNDIIEAGGLNYHTPFDEVKPWFRYDGILQELELAKEVGIYYATDGLKPKFDKENPFAPAKLLWNKGSE